MASKGPRQSTFFIPGNDIDREVITRDICQHVGNDALVKPGYYKVNGRETQGFYILAYRPPTSAQIDDLKRDSARWREERTRNETSRKGYPYPGTGFNPSYTAPSPYGRGIAPDPRDTDYDVPPLTPQMGHPMEPASTTPNHSSSQQNTQRSAPIRSLPEPVRPVGGNIRDIKLFHPVTGQSRNTGALLDTGCVTDNWITSQMVSKLGADSLINYSAPMKTMQAADMGPVKSKGIIELDFRWLPKGAKVHTTSFNVADAFQYDVIIGNEYIDENRLHKSDEDALSPMTEHDPVISPSELPIHSEMSGLPPTDRLIDESEDMRQAGLRQEQEKVDREEAESKSEGQGEY